MSAKSKSVWGIILKSIVAVATALAGVFGLSSCIGRWEPSRLSSFIARPRLRAWPRASNKGGLGLYNILTGSMIICDIFHKIHILFDKREKTYQVVLAIIKFVSRKLFHNPLFQILRKIGTDMSCNALHCHLFHIMFHHDTYPVSYTHLTLPTN